MNYTCVITKTYSRIESNNKYISSNTPLNETESSILSILVDFCLDSFEKKMFGMTIKEIYDEINLEQ